VENPKTGFPLSHRLGLNCETLYYLLGFGFKHLGRGLPVVPCSHVGFQAIVPEDLIQLRILNNPDEVWIVPSSEILIASILRRMELGVFGTKIVH